MPHAGGDVPAPLGAGRRGGQGDVHRHGRDVQTSTVNRHRGAVRHGPRRGAGQRGVCQGAQHGAPERVAVSRRGDDGGGAVWRHNRGLGDEPVQD